MPRKRWRRSRQIMLNRMQAKRSLRWPKFYMQKRPRRGRISVKPHAVRHLRSRVHGSLIPPQAALRLHAVKHRQTALPPIPTHHSQSLSSISVLPVMLSERHTDDNTTTAYCHHGFCMAKSCIVAL